MDGKLNHFEIRLTQDTAEFWASDYEDPASFRRRATIENLDLPFSIGYVHFQHAQYNAAKDGNVTSSQTFRWDNVGFDGPVWPTPRGYDVQNAGRSGPDGGEYFGWDLPEGEPVSLTVSDVDLTDATSASLNLNVVMRVGDELQYRFNGNAWHSFVIPDGATPEYTILRGFTLDAPLEELVDGDNEIEVMMPREGVGYEGMGNVDITVEVP
jgi:hypothetical protein